MSSSPIPYVIALYIRLSTEDSKVGSFSIENQKNALHQYVDAMEDVKNVEVVEFIDNGYSGTNFERPAVQELLDQMREGKINCIVVKDFTRFGRNSIEVGYFMEMFFPSNNIRFVSINDQFDTTDGITSRDKSAYIQSSTRVPLINLFNEQVSVETKMKVEVVLDMKAQHGEFIGPRAPFGYQKSNENPNQLIPDPVAAVIVRKIFEMAASGTGVTGIVRYLNERGLPTPIHYARAHGLEGNFDDGNGSWNSRSVKYILTNRTYTGMLVQGKEKRAVEATHEPLVDSSTFDAIQKSFQARAYNVAPQGQSADNILKGKVICGCCGGKMQRKRGTGHADWHFFTCITKNRLGADKCTGMYAREEDIFNAIYRQLRTYVSEHYITVLQHKQQIQQFNDKIFELAQSSEKAWTNAMEYYEQYVRGEVNKEALRSALDVAHNAKAVLAEVTEQKAAYEKEYNIFHKLLSASDKRISLSEIIDYIDEIVVDKGSRIVVKFQ